MKTIVTSHEWGWNCNYEPVEAAISKLFCRETELGFSINRSPVGIQGASYEAGAI